MAAIIDTEHKVVDAYGADIHGFTPGNDESGVPATELSAGWCNAVQQELNNAINPGLDGTTLDGETLNQLNTSISNQIVNTHPRVSAGSYTYTFRSMGDGYMTGPGAQCLARRRTEFKYHAASNTSNDLAVLNIPDDSQCAVTYTICAVRTDSGADYGNAIIHASVRNNGGTVTIQSASNALLDISLAGLTIALNAGAASSIRVRVVFPAAPAAKTYNIMVKAELVNVMQ